MIVLFILLLIVCLYGIKYKTFHEDYMSKQSTNAIKGIFAIIILFSHMRGYLVLSENWMNKAYIDVLDYIGQAMVAMYLFYSGYGIMESVKCKESYRETFFVNRIVKTLINFDLAVFLYLIFNIVRGVQYTYMQYVTCWIGWESIGNSNWFIFDILVLYLIVYFGMLLCKECQIYRKRFCFITFLLSLLLWIILRIVKGEPWWVNTIFTFPLGIYFSIIKQKFEIVINKNYFFVTLVVGCFLCIWHNFRGDDGLGIYTCVFSILVVLLSMKVKMNNVILQWLGKNAFSIYILQRLPMHLYSTCGLSITPPIFVLLSVLTTLLLSYFFTMVTKRVDKYIIIN